VINGRKYVTTPQPKLLAEGFRKSEEPVNSKLDSQQGTATSKQGQHSHESFAKIVERNETPTSAKSFNFFMLPF